MSIIHPQNFDQAQNSNIVDDNLDNDDLITFQNNSMTINLYYSQLTKYSKYIRDSYLFKNVIDRFPQEIQKFQEEYQLLPDNVDFFFQILLQNCNFDKNLKLTYIQCRDLLKISKFLDIRKLSFKINEYITDQKMDVDFVLQMIQYEIETQKETEGHSFGISQEIEQVLTSKINECLTNEKFKELPIQIIHRVVSKSSPNSINSNKLFDIIMKSLSKYCVLFPFLDLQKLSEDRLDDLCEIYSKSDENTQQYFNFLKCNLNLIREINKRKKNLQKQFSDSENQLKDSKELNNEQQSKIIELETKVASLQKQFINSENQLKDSKELNNEQQSKIIELETKVASLQKQFGDSENNNDQLQRQVSHLQNKLSCSEKEISDVRKQLDEIFLIKGQITAKVENGLFISAEINLKENGSSLDTSKSKFIISSSGEKSLGSEAYEKGEPITSFNMKTASYMCRPGTYFVRCIVFSSIGRSNEIVSNSVTLSGSSVTFGYEGKPSKISLYQGKYKLEVWGAKGGDSTGKSFNESSNYNRWKQSSVQGGLGGYSRGTLYLKENETVYVYVGGEGRPSDLSDGSSTKGGFPDGGGAKTGHWSSCQTVPGTGGGSTSIRIGSDTEYARVIVAGGGGGASGDSAFVSPGGFGGGQTGGNCTHKSSLQNQGAGTQSGSSCGLGYSDGLNGDPGQFGLGATGKYCKGCDSGGGGGGGWYGGGSGGYGSCTWVSSGGGGSGWTFTEKSLGEWQRGDSANASKFVLNSSHFLTDCTCLGGNEEFPRPDGNGIERGHTGNGYAKITPV